MPSIFRVLCGCFLFTASGYSEEATLTLLSINDVYEILPRNGHGGFAELMTILKEERADAEHYLTTVNGDFLSPSLISGIYQGSQMIDLFNRLEVDVVVFGNHEFDYGVDVLLQRMDESHFCWLGTNVLSLQRERPLSKARGSVVFEIEGIKIGMIGLCTTETNQQLENFHEVIVTPPVLTAQAAVHKLKKEGVDVIIALTHLTFEEDRNLAIQVPEIDLILGGHDHEVMTWYNGHTLVHKSGHDAEFIARIDLKIEKKDIGQKTKVAVYPKWKMIPNHGFSQDEEIAGYVAGYADKVDDELSQQIAVCSGPLDGVNVRCSETTLGNLFADALRDHFRADAALINGGGIRSGKKFPAGHGLTKRDVQEALPFANVAVLVEVTGEQLLRTLEASLAKTEVNGGSFPQVSGIRLIYDPENPPGGKRICEAYVDGKPVDKFKTYQIATNDFILKGGDGNWGLKHARLVVGPGVGPLLTSVVVDYLKKHPFAQATIEGRIFDGSIARDMKLIDTSDKRIQLD